MCGSWDDKRLTVEQQASTFSGTTMKSSQAFQQASILFTREADHKSGAQAAYVLYRGSGRSSKASMHGYGQFLMLSNWRTTLSTPPTSCNLVSHSVKILALLLLALLLILLITLSAGTTLLPTLHYSHASFLHIVCHPTCLPYLANSLSALNLSISSSLKQMPSAISPSGVLGIKYIKPSTGTNRGLLTASDLPIPRLKSNLKQSTCAHELSIMSTDKSSVAEGETTFLSGLR